MEWDERVRCRNCGGLNEPDRQHCSICGAPLRRPMDGPGAAGTWRRVVRGAVVVLLAAVMLGVAGGVYYTADRYLLGGSNSRQEEVGDTSASATADGAAAQEVRAVAAAKDRYGTAIAISELAFPEGAPALVLVAGDDYSEAVCVAPLAAAYDGAVLPVPPAGITSALGAEIERLDPARVFLVGVSEPTTLTRRLEDILHEPVVTMLSGGDRHETAAQVAKEVRARAGTVSKVVIVPSTGFVDAVSVAPLAAAKGWPILFALKDGHLPQTSADVIEGFGVISVLAVGIRVDLPGIDVKTLTGADRYETAAQVVEYALAQGARFEHTALASGDDFPDALVAGSYVALDDGVLLLTRAGELPPAALALLEANLRAIHTIDFVALPGLAKKIGITGPGA